MRYDFTTIMDRKGKDAIALDVIETMPGYDPNGAEKGLDPIPMWIADMNFPACPAILDAIIGRTQHPAYGYFMPSKAYFDAIIHWQEEHNGAAGLAVEHIGYENGVLGGVISALNVFCSKGDNVLIHSPTYTGFSRSLGLNGYHMIHSPLIRDAEGVWRMDYEDMEQKIVKKKIHAMVFCSPHNPCGRVWERWELEKMIELCEKYDVKVISDEIWSDIIRPGQRHIPTQMTNEWARQNTVALYAPSKTFNLAGLVGSYHIIYNKWVRDRVVKEASLSHYNEMNVLSMYALIGAYSEEGAQWLEELRQVLAGNVDFACDYIGKRFKGVEVFKPEGTYMLFLNCGEWCETHGKTMDELLQAGVAAGVIWQDGRKFNGPSHIRMNLALPLSRVQEAFDRLDKYVFNA